MGLQSALTTALTGLQAAETTIDVVGNNVANSQTVGFKESDAVFATQFLQTISIGSAPSNTSGGTNPRQIGLGVKVAEISPDFSQGTIEISSNPLDLAIQGDGFLIVQSEDGDVYTRNGQLKLNKDNEIVTATGQRVLGYGNENFVIQERDVLEPLRIPVGEDRVRQATTEATFAGNLNPTVQEGTIQSVSESIVLGNGSIPQPVATDPATNPFDIFDFQLADKPVTSSITSLTTGGGTGPGGGADFTATYKIVFIDSAGTPNESTPSVEFSVPADGTELQLNNLPQGNPDWSGGARIYRQVEGGTDFHRVGQIAGGVTTFNDSVADGAPLTAGEILEEEVIEPGSYDYYVTYYDSQEQVETRPTTRIGTRTVAEPGGRVRIDLSALETPVDPLGRFDFDQIRIYRHPSGDNSQYYRVDTAPILVTGDDIFIDQVSDANLTDPTNEVLNLNGPVAREDTRLVDLVIYNGTSYESNLFEEGTLTFTAVKDGVQLEPKTLAITGDPNTPGPPGTTVLELMQFIQQAAGIDTDLVASPDQDPDEPNPSPGSVSLVNGQIIIASNLGEENVLRIPLTSLQMQPTGSTGNSTVPISFNESVQANGPGASTEFTVYDSLGSGLNVRITTVLEDKDPDATIFRWYATSGDNEPSEDGVDVNTVVGDGLLKFDQNGALLSVTSNSIRIDRNISASLSPLEIELDFDKVTAQDVNNNFNEPVSTLNVTSQDGFPPGVLTDFVITEDGTIQGQFSNGTQRPLGRIVMARFANTGGLQQIGDGLFRVGVNSGPALRGVAGTDGLGTLSAGAVELSNTDIGQNLIELILASTQYRGGARVITATQELLDELLALSR